MPNKIGDFLADKFLEWEHCAGKRLTYDKFSQYLGVSRSTLSKWMSGNSKPDHDSLESLAEKLGPEIYDVMDLPRPDPDLVYIIKHWGALSSEQRKEIRERAEEYHAESSKTDDDLGLSHT